MRRSEGGKRRRWISYKHILLRLDKRIWFLYNIGDAGDHDSRDTRHGGSTSMAQIIIWDNL